MKTSIVCVLVVLGGLQMSCSSDAEDCRLNPYACPPGGGAAGTPAGGSGPTTTGSGAAGSGGSSGSSGIGGAAGQGATGGVAGSSTGGVAGGGTGGVAGSTVTGGMGGSIVAGGAAGSDPTGGTGGSSVGNCLGLTPVTLGYGNPLPYTGATFAGGAGLEVPGCNQKGPARLYAVTVTGDGFLTASISRPGTSFNSGLIVRKNCASTMNEICADSTGAGNHGGEVVSVPVLANQTLVVIVDGVEPGDVGNYHLDLDLSIGDDCSDAVPVRVEKGGGVVLRGNTSSKTNDTHGTQCLGGDPFDNLSAGKDSNDVVYGFTYAEKTASTTHAPSASYDLILYARSSCETGQIACDNDVGGGEEISLPNNHPDVFLWVDGLSGANGSYELTVTP